MLSAAETDTIAMPFFYDLRGKYGKTLGNICEGETMII